jgi:hypothetical protein
VGLYGRMLMESARLRLMVAPLPSETAGVEPYVSISTSRQ